MTFLSFLFLSIQLAQQPRSGWPSYVFRRFGRTWWSWIHAPLRELCSTPKIARQKRTKSSITQPWLIPFRSNFVQSLNAWHPKCCKSSMPRGQRSRWQRETMEDEKGKGQDFIEVLLFTLPATDRGFVTCSFKICKNSRILLNCHNSLKFVEWAWLPVEY